MCPSGGMADAAVSKTVVSRRASSTLASGTSLSILQGGPLGRLFRSLSKKRPKGVVLVVQMQEMRETILRVRKPQWLLTPAEREDEASPLAPARLATLNTVDQHEKRRDAPHARGASLRKRCRKKRSVIPLSQPSASSQWRQSSSRPSQRARSPARTAALRESPAAPARARCRSS